LDEKVDLLSSFFSSSETEKFTSNDRELINIKALFILKKILIQLITVLDIMKLYINMNLNCKFYKSNQFGSSKEVLSYNKSMISDISSFKNNNANSIFPINKKFKVCKILVSKTLNELIELINVKDVSTYVLMTNVYMSGKENFRKIHLYEGHSFTINIKINEEVLFYKSKRKDELVKFSFKFIRKQLINNHRKKISGKSSKLKAQFVRKDFNEKVLKNDSEVIEYFYSMEVNKKNLKSLRRAPEVIKMVNKYKENYFLEDQIIFNIFQKKENIFREDVSLLDFIKKIFIVQNKNNVTLQSVLNSLYVFDSFFKF
jgi:hypothetical protein